MNKCDNAKSKDEYEKKFEEAKMEWKRHGIKESNIFPVSSGVLCEDKQSSDKIKEDLSKLGLDNDGVEKFKAKIETYITEKRNSMLREYLEKQKEIFNIKKKKLFDYLNKIIPESMSESEFQHNLIETRLKVFNKWWVQEWKHIDEELNEFFQNNIHGNTSKEKALRNNFVKIIDKLEKQIKDSFTEEVAKKLYISKTVIIKLGSPSESHSLIRMHLYDLMKENFKSVFKELSELIQDEINKVIDWMYKRLYKIKEVKAIIGTDKLNVTNLDVISNKIEAFMFRFIYPAMFLFLRFPRSERKESIEQFMSDIIILGFYILNIMID